MATIGNQIINLGPQDLAISVTQALPAAGAAATTGILDLSAVAPNSDAWRIGRIAVVIPALPENTAGAGITFALQAASASLTNSAPAPAPAVPGAFFTPICAQTITIPAVAAVGSAATIAYFTLASDANGSSLEFYQFVTTVPAGVVTVGENIVFAYVEA